MLNDLGSALTGLLAVAIILMGLRYLLDPEAGRCRVRHPRRPGRGCARQRMAGRQSCARHRRRNRHRRSADRRSAPTARLPGARCINDPVADGTIVLRAGGPKAIAYGVHWSTAAVMLTAAALLVI